MTEKRERERRLRDSEEKFSKIFRSSPDAVSISAIEDGRYLDVNESYERLFEHAAADVVGRTALEIGLWVRPEQRAEMVRRLKQTGTVRDLEVEFRTASGGIRFCSLAAEVIRIGERDCLVATVRDMTERRAAAERLRDSEERLRLALEAARMGTWEWSLATGAVAWSEQVRSIMGLDGREFDGTLAAYLGRLHPDDRPEVERTIEQIQSGDADDFYSEHRAIGDDGVARWIEARGRIHRDSAGRPVLVRGTVADVTRRKRAEQELQQAAREWRDGFDALDVGIVVADEAGLVRRANRAALETLGCGDLAELEGRPLSSLGAAEPWRVLASLAPRRRRARAPGLEIRDPTSGTCWLVGVSPLPRESDAPGWSIFHFRDVTETERLRDELQRRETLAAVGSLVAGVAHEVRTPLFSMSATLDAFQDHLDSREDKDEFVGLLRAQVKRLTNLMTDLLDYGKPAALRRTSGGIADILRKAARSCERIAGEAGVAVEVVAEPALAELRRDAVRLEQVFQNLLANAIQHSPRGGTVRLTARPLGDSRPGVRVTVDDDGPGLDEKELDRVFQPFYSRRKGGTGLGLSLVQRIVLEHGGTVSAANRPAGGAVFSVVLPAAERGRRR